MPDQTGRNISIAFKAQPTLGVPATGAGASVFRYSGGSGLNLRKNKIRSSESRSDGQSTLGRHGHRSVEGGYNAPLSLGTFDALLEAIVRGTFDAPLSITNTQMTSITTTANTIVAAGGSWITQGLRIGDVIRLTGHAQAANNGKNLRIVGLTATVITVAETLVADATADSTFTITRPKKVINPAIPVRRLFTFEERYEDLDSSELFPDVRVSSLRIRMPAEGEVSLEFGLVGRDMQVLEGAASPNFTSPTPTASLGLVAADASIRLGSQVITTITALDFALNLNATTQPVIGSMLSRDVYDGNLQPITGTFSAIRDDMEMLKKYLNEEQLALHLLLVEPESEPKDFISVVLPLLTLDGNTKNLGQDGPLIQSIPFEAGKQTNAGGGINDQTMIAIQSSAV